MTTSSLGEDEPLDRGRPQRELEALIAEAHAVDQAALVRVTGPPGIGKTTFLRYVASSKKCTLWTSAETTDRTRPGEWARRVAGSSADVRSEYDSLFAAARAAIETYSTVCIDDVQWLDELSRQILKGLVRERGASLTWLLGDRRQGAPELGAHRTLSLTPIRSTSAARLVRRVYAGAPAEVVSEIVAAASGLPFDVVFLAEQAAREGARFGDETEPSTTAAIARRLERSDETAREAMRYGACLEAADLRVIARAMRLNVDAVSHALSDVSDLASVRDLRLVFRHAAIATAVQLSMPDAVPYHARLLDALGDDDRPDALHARLRCARACGADDVSASCALRLGRILAAASSLQTAAQYLETAVQYVRRPIPTAFATDYAGVLQQLFRDADAATFLRREIDAAIDRHDVLAAAELLTSLFSAALTLERFTELETLCTRVERIAANDHAVRARLRTVRLASLAFAGRLDDYAREAESGEMRWNDLRPASFAAALRGDPEGARHAFESYRGALGSEHARQEPSDRVLHAMTVLLDAGTLGLAELESTDGTPASAREHPVATALRIFGRIGDGRWDDARRLFDHVPLWDDAYDEPYGLLDVRLLLDALGGREPSVRRRTLATIRKMIGRGQVRHAASPARWYAVATLASQARLEPEIEEFVRDSLDVSPMPYQFAALPCAVPMLAERLGKERCAAALSRWPSYGARWHRAHDDLALGLLEDDGERLRTARSALETLGAPAFAAIAGLALPIPRARDIALANALGFGARAVRARAKLTARERDVAELAAGGKTNQEIGAHLEISVRTVETHLTSAFRKLEVRSRSELAAQIIR